MEEKELIKKLDSVKTNYELLEILDNNPPSNWVKQHPNITNYKYLPIDKVEFLLKKIFKFNYKIEVLSTKELFNATSVTVRIHFQEIENPKNWYYHDGTGADAPEKDEKGNYKDYSVAASLPLAKTNAIKDACDHFGRLFGSDLNRSDILISNTKLSPKQKLEKIKNLFDGLEKNIPSKDYSNYKRIIENEEENSYNKALTGLETIKNNLKK